MKNSINYFLLASLLVSTVVFSSAYFIVESKVVSVIPSKTSFLYAGIENPVTIVASGVDSKNLVVKGSYGTSIRPDTAKNGIYYIVANETGKCTLTINAKTDNGLKTIATQELRVKRLPDPIVYFGDRKGDDAAEAGTFEKAEGLVCKLENVDFDVKFFIQSFVMSVNHNGEWIDYTSESDQFTPEMKSELLSATSGSRIFIHHVNVKGADSQMRILPGLSLLIR